jgi:hypothetical protein
VDRIDRIRADTQDFRRDQERSTAARHDQAIDLESAEHRYWNVCLRFAGLGRRVACDDREQSDQSNFRLHCRSNVTRTGADPSLAVLPSCPASLPPQQ